MKYVIITRMTPQFARPVLLCMLLVAGGCGRLGFDEGSDLSRQSSELPEDEARRLEEQDAGVVGGQGDSGQVSSGGEGEPNLPSDCTGWSSDACGEGRYCNTRRGPCNGSGVCADVDSSPDCPPGETIGGSCGCDGQMYATQCDADRVGVPLAPSQTYCTNPDQ